MNDYINLTPHTIVVRLDNGTDFAIKPSGSLLRVDTVAAEKFCTDENVRVNLLGPTEAGLRDAVLAVRRHLASSDGTKGLAYVIVSGIALDWMASLLTQEERHRVLSPDTSPGSAIRAPSGRLIAVRALRMANLVL